MQFDFTQTLYKNTLQYKQPCRAQIYVGFKCSQKCGFCYYRHKLNTSMFDINCVYRQIDFELQYGIKDFEITGGEPGEYKYLRNICQYIKDKSPSSKIAIITNGSIWNSNIWDLIDEVLLSYHIGKNTLDVDKNIFPYGNTYNKAYRTIDKIKTYKKLFRLNTVLGTFNINYIDDILNDIYEFKPSIVNFLPVNLFDEAIDMYRFINYDIFREKIKYAIDFIKEKMPNCLVFVRYFPFCNMESYEQYIVGNIQHIYDWFDWNKELGGIQLLDFINDYDNSLKKLGKYGSTSIQSAIDVRNSLYEKTKDCLYCKYFLLCDGVEKTNSHVLQKYINPSIGQHIKNFMFFINNTTFDFYKKHYA